MMGTRSKHGYNDRCTQRGPVSGERLGSALQVIDEHQRGVARHNRVKRRSARATVRKAARYVRARIDPVFRTSLQQQVIRLDNLMS